MNEKDDFDLDAVCVLNKFDIHKFSQKSAKEMVGYEINKYVKKHNFKKEATEGKRCWTMEYAESAQFHMDILPAIPDKIGFVRLLEERKVAFDSSDPYMKYALAITDNTNGNYPIVDTNWPRSNPKGFHEWFKKRLIVKKTAYDERLKMAFEHVEDIPDNSITSPLQKAIMILKRHRDILFQDDKEDKPISIIITTLAATAYQGEDNIHDALITILSELDNIPTKDGMHYVTNPVNPLENFADKWENLLSE
ncbi:hypothetical protein [Sulfurimonas sp.]|uniref:hypothetical protein n=1 Tax=Sulfurimonas sp. TaxID=2022749 RepID=UPI0019EC93F3|nr:hypothetical protein [Sulfurimonas sp.]MBE0513909.1 hypothetical protein [Sulfurimonas sp.]